MTSRPHFDSSGSPLVDAQRAETGVSGTIGPSTAAIPDSMSRGLWRGTVIGAVIGAIVLTPVAFIPMFDLAILGKLVIVWVVGLAGGATIGSVFFGGAVAETEDVDSDGDDHVVPSQMHRSH